MLLSCVDFIQRHFCLTNSEVCNYFVPIRKKDIPFNLFNPANDYKSKSYVLYDSDKNDVYIAFKSSHGFCYYRSCDSRVCSSWISFNEV